MSQRRPLRVEIVGLFPNREANHPAAGPLAPPPASLLANQAAAEHLLKALTAWTELPIRVVIVDATSPRGLWLSLKHRLGEEPVAFVDGRLVPTLDPDAVLVAVQQALGLRNGPS